MSPAAAKGLRALGEPGEPLPAEPSRAAPRQARRRPLRPDDRRGSLQGTQAAPSDSPGFPRPSCPLRGRGGGGLGRCGAPRIPTGWESEGLRCPGPLL